MPTSSQDPYPISFLDPDEVLGRDGSPGGLERVLEGDVTLSAIPDGSGGTTWRARTKAGEALPTFRLTITPETGTPETGTPETAAARGPVVIDATEGVYVCYEDTARQQSWCVKVK